MENSTARQIKGPKTQAQNLDADFLKCEGRIRMETPSSLTHKLLIEDKLLILVKNIKKNL